MKHWWLALAVFAFSGCSHTPTHRSSAFDCGIPILDGQPVGGRVEIGPPLDSELRQQLAPNIAVEDGCWAQLPNGRLEGTYAAPDTEKGYNTDIYLFEYRDQKWTLAETRHELQFWVRHK